MNRKGNTSSISDGGSNCKREQSLVASEGGGSRRGGGPLSSSTAQRFLATDASVSSHSTGRRSWTITSSATSKNTEEEAFGYLAQSDPRSSGTTSSVSRKGSVTASITPATRSSSNNNPLENLTIDKLHFSQLKFHGREEEQKILQEAFQRVASIPSESENNFETSGRELVLIRGSSGVGKTKLAQTLKNMKTKPGLFITGKFQNGANTSPYSGIANAGAELCGILFSLLIDNRELAEEILQEIKTELDDELTVLAQVIPALGEVFDNLDIFGQSATASPASSKNQLQFAFVRLFRVISRKFAPFVLLLDDLQWASAPSLELLEVLLTDELNTKLLILGSCRSEANDQTHVFAEAIQQLQQRADDEKKPFTLVTIELGNLTPAAVQPILNNLLNLDDSDERTAQLADLCWKKTDGNVYFILQYIKMLKEIGLLTFNYGSLKWTWDCDTIESSTAVSDNVLDSILTTMEYMESSKKLILQIAACLGFSFDAKLLQLAWIELRRKLQQLPTRDLSLQESMEQLVEKGFLVKISGPSEQHSYCFEHDKIREAALSLIGDNAKCIVFQRQIGECLVTKLNPEDIGSSYIFVVVNLLDGGETKQGEIAQVVTRMDLAKLFDQACSRAIVLSAFESGAEYAGKGIALLPDNAWQEYYDLTLNLYSNGAKAEGFISNRETMEKYCKAVMAHEMVPLEDKFDVYNSWIDSHMAQGREGMEYGKILLEELLGKLGIKFSKNPLKTLWVVLKNLSKTKTLLKTLDVMALPRTENPITGEIMRLLDKLTHNMYLTEDPRLPAVMYKSLNVSLKRGLTDYSPVAFCTVGMILNGVANDLKGAFKYGEIALRLVERDNIMISRCRTGFLVYTFLYPWTMATRSVLQPLVESYKVGLKTGDIENACASIMIWIQTKFRMGTPLVELDANCRLYSQQLRNLKRDQALCPILVQWQLIRNMINSDKADPGCLIGDVFTEENFQYFEHYPGFEINFRAMECMGWTYLGRHIECSDRILKHGINEFKDGFLALGKNTGVQYLRGVSCYAAAQETGKRKYARGAQLMRKQIKLWLKNGDPNITHYDNILDAEHLAYKGLFNRAVKMYETAILFAGREGYLQDAALANERLALLHLHRLKDEDEAVYRFQEAIKYWAAWAADTKVKSLQRIIKKLTAPATKPVDLVLNKEMAVSDLALSKEMGVITAVDILS